MRHCPSSRPENAILIACAVLGMASPGVARAEIFGAVASNGAIILTNVPGKAGLAVIVAGDPPAERDAKRAQASSSGSGDASRFADVIDEASRTFRVQPELLRAVIDVESRYNPKAVSDKGALGLMQVMPETARRFAGGDMLNPRDNVLTGARYLRFLLDLFKDDVELTVAAYNAGENAVIRAGYRVPSVRETRLYVPRVLERYRRMLAAG
ncbi:lytic transglycosylase domain-containing protein [Paraburkholderia aspalathi]|jgi:soluble lytic murein transglycosylase-like protein|uniref:Transglycosylase SLT domain-containing protein n=2 Tax=Paraburkholderia TaxID=1822464 RepID=A0A1I7A1N3_9BURK|nr:Membrane-bound lytic murein transglycosylase C [Paraburkholderia aspalathi]CAE6744501.1 Membrane-bound lytic murein transglycosylase C [Paraburkholderia aspalathi]SFT68848.1 Transglycosylase SLT domain-containing protein [Paraburkholderia aspalathi]